MTKTKENDWAVFLAELGYKQGDTKHDTVFKKFEGAMTTPAKLVSVWAENVLASKCEDWLKTRGIDDADDLTNIIAGIMALKDKTDVGLNLNLLPSGYITLASGYMLFFVHILGRGANSVVFQAYDLQLLQYVVVKITPVSASLAQIAVETLALSELASCIGVPKCIHTSTFQEKFEALVTDKPGVSLASIALKFGKLSTPLLFAVAVRILRILTDIHSKGVIHRDLKPENIVVWRRQIILIDFGLASIRGKQLQPASGTPAYSSVVAMSTNVPLPWDDLESLGYTLLSLAKGKLPWDGKSWRQIIKQKKQPAKKICVGLPAIFADFLDYSHVSRNRFSAPNYVLWINKFRKAYRLSKCQ